MLRVGDIALHGYRITCVAPHAVHATGGGHNHPPTRPCHRTSCDWPVKSTQFLLRSYLLATKIGYHPARGRGPDTRCTLVIVHTVAATRSAHINARSPSPAYFERSRAGGIAPCFPTTERGVGCVSRKTRQRASHLGHAVPAQRNLGSAARSSG